MKKFVVIVLIGIFGTLTLGSCRKDYRCECVIKENASYPAVVNRPINGDLSPKQAKKACKKNEKSFYDVDDDDVKCSLK